MIMIQIMITFCTDRSVRLYTFCVRDRSFAQGSNLGLFGGVNLPYLHLNKSFVELKVWSKSARGHPFTLDSSRLSLTHVATHSCVT